MNLVEDDYRGRFKASCVVLENEAHGPQMCLGPVLLSMPLQCGGPSVAGWSWDSLRHVRRGNSRYGCYTVVGHYDGRRLTLTETPSVWDPVGTSSSLAVVANERFWTPCPPPPGGWRTTDPALATREALHEAIHLAKRSPAFGALWVDRNMSRYTASQIAYDPAKIILNVVTTADREAMDRTLRSVWGGALCVSAGARTEDDVAQAQKTVERLPGVVTCSRDARAGIIDLTVVRATEQLQARLNAMHGFGLVNLIGALMPLD